MGPTGPTGPMGIDGNPMGMGFATLRCDVYYKLLRKLCHYESSCPLDTGCFDTTCAFL